MADLLFPMDIEDGAFAPVQVNISLPVAIYVECIEPLQVKERDGLIGRYIRNLIMADLASKGENVQDWIKHESIYWDRQGVVTVNASSKDLAKAKAKVKADRIKELKARFGK